MRTVLRWGEQDRRSWTFVAPIGNLVLGDAVNRELRVNRVSFVDRGKLPFVRRRLGFHRRISDIDRGKGNSSFFKKAATYAVLRHRGAPQQVEEACLKTIRDELAIVSLSYLVYAKRKHVSFPALLGRHNVRPVQFVIVNSDNPSGIAVGASVTSPQGILLNGRWALSQSARTFHKLTQILSRSISVDARWRSELQRASILIGEGLESEDRAMSFLKNMIALESLLTRRGDRVSNTLPIRARAFLGWVGLWEVENHEQRIEEIYKKRNALVHSGDKDGVKSEDLVFSDDLLFNLITNLVSFPELFRSKETIIRFSNKVAAEHQAGNTEEVRPKGLIYTRSRYRKEDLERL
jgi:hypothetical protein